MSQLVYRDLTLRQSEVLAQIATGEQPRAAHVTLNKLIHKGLIVRIADRIVGHDALGPIGLPQYEMPTAEHIAWCEWASQSYEPSS